MAQLPRLFSLKLVFFLLATLCGAAQALAAEITALRSWRAPDNTRLVLDLSAPVQYRLSPESTPARLVVEIDDAHTAGPLALPPVQPPLKALRLEKKGSGQRLVIDTSVELQPKIFQLKPNEKYGHRLVLDLYDKPTGKVVTLNDLAQAGEKALTDKAAPAPDKTAGTPPAPVLAPGNGPVAQPMPAETPKTVAGDAGKKAATPEPTVPEKFDPQRYRNVIVAIDAGHGGEDPGAIGRDGTYEKNVTLAIAKELYEQLKAAPGITPVLTRNGDYFIPLVERRRMARYQQKADIFVSVHADSAGSRAASGASVFALSLKGANTATSRFARMLAERENRADLIGGVEIEKDDDILRNVLADMVVAGSLEHSLRMGRNILQGLKHVGSLHNEHVEQAGFAVLKEPGMVSLLVETGFISNPSEEKKLTSKKYQQEVAEAVANGVLRYCREYPAPSTYFAWLADKDRPAVARALPVATVAPPAPVLVAATTPMAVKSAPRYLRYKVRRGDNLTRLAERYKVSIDDLRDANHLRSDNVMIGQVLKIPAN